MNTRLITKNKDIVWNIKIDYSKIKALKTGFKAPIFIPEKVSKNASYKREKTFGSSQNELSVSKYLEEYKAECFKIFTKENLLNNSLQKLYSVTGEYVISNSTDSNNSEIGRAHV